MRPQTPSRRSQRRMILCLLLLDDTVPPDFRSLPLTDKR